MKEKIRDRRNNSSYPEIRVKRVRVNGFQLYIYIFFSFTSYCAITGKIPIKTHFSVSFYSAFPLTDSYTIKSVRVGGKI